MDLIPSATESYGQNEVLEGLFEPSFLRKFSSSTSQPLKEAIEKLTLFIQNNPSIPKEVVLFQVKQKILEIQEKGPLPQQPSYSLTQALQTVSDQSTILGKTFFFPDGKNALVQFNITGEQFAKLEETLKESFSTLDKIPIITLQKCIQEIQKTAADEGLKSSEDLESYMKVLSSVHGTTVFSEILAKMVTLELLAEKASAELAQQKIQGKLGTLQQEPLPHFNNGLRALAWGMDALMNLINFQIQAIVFLMEPDHFSRDRLMRALGSTSVKVAAEPLWWITTGLHKKKVEDMQEDEKMAVLALSVLYDGVGEDALMKHFSQLSINDKAKFLAQLGGLQGVIQAGGKGLLRGGTWNWQRFDKIGNKTEKGSISLSPGLFTALQQDRNGVQEFIKKCEEWLAIERKQFDEQTSLFQQQAEARLPTKLSEPLKESPEDLYGHLRGLLAQITKKKTSLTPDQHSSFDAIQTQLTQLGKTLKDQPLVALEKDANQNNLHDRIEGAFKAALIGPYSQALALYHEILKTPALSPEDIQLIEAVTGAGPTVNGANDVRVRVAA